MNKIMYAIMFGSGYATIAIWRKLFKIERGK